MKKLFMIITLAFMLFAASVFIPLRGHYVQNAVRYGDSEYRDNRGIPFVFLKRALADGECEVASKESTECLPVAKYFEVQDQRQFSYLYLIIDGLFWLAVAFV